MQREMNVEQIKRRVKSLVGEVMRGEHSIDFLPNSSYDFSEERQAMYFSNARKNMKSDMAHATIECGQQLEDIKILKRLHKNG